MARDKETDDDLALMEDESEEPSPELLIDVPDIVQPDHYSCGAAAAMCVGRYWGVGPKTLGEWKKALGTDVEESTRPDAIAEYLKELGLDVEARSGMTIHDLRLCWRDGLPVICCLQDYGPSLPKKAAFAYGHFLTVIGVDMGYVFGQDSSEDNVIRGSGSIVAPGRVMIRARDFLKNWHDKDINGKKYMRYGIAAGRMRAPRAPEIGKGMLTHMPASGPHITIHLNPQPSMLPQSRIGLPKIAQRVGLRKLPEGK
jgi:hypothetical protein